MADQRDKSKPRWLRISVRAFMLAIFLLCASLAWLVPKVREGARKDQELQQMVNDYDERWSGVRFTGGLGKIAFAEKERINRFCEDRNFTLWLNSLFDSDAAYRRWIERSEP